MTAQLVDGRYELQHLLGSGGMGEVWRAYDDRLDRAVAIKLLNVSVPDPRLRQRFEREARAAASFSHPNAVTVYDFGEEGSRPYIVMELVEGESLADVIARRAPLPVDEVVRIGDQVLAALGAAHRHGLVHRDVKPGNVLLTRDGQAKLADFGIATTVGGAAGAALTATGEVLGTPHYLSPEQVSGQAATPRSDLYATGVMLYEMLAGSPPFTGETPMAVALAHQQSPVRPLRTYRPDVDPALARAVERALEKDPARRHRDAESMRLALTAGAADATAAITASPTQTAVLERPPDDVTAAPVAGRPWWPLVAVLALLGLLVLWLALAERDDEPRVAAPATTARPAPTTTAPAPTTTSTSPPTTPQTTSPSRTTAVVNPTLPANLTPESVALAAIAQQVAMNPQAYGDKGEDLARALTRVQQANPNQRRERAAEAIQDIREWVSEGQLEPGMGAAAISVLTPFAR